MRQISPGLKSFVGQSLQRDVPGIFDLRPHVRSVRGRLGAFEGVESRQILYESLKDRIAGFDDEFEIVATRPDAYSAPIGRGGAALHAVTLHGHFDDDIASDAERKLSSELGIHRGRRSSVRDRVDAASRYGNTQRRGLFENVAQVFMGSPMRSCVTLSHRYLARNEKRYSLWHFVPQYQADMQAEHRKSAHLCMRTRHAEQR